jgi:hypothetical protein
MTIGGRPGGLISLSALSQEEALLQTAAETEEKIMQMIDDAKKNLA